VNETADVVAPSEAIDDGQFHHLDPRSVQHGRLVAGLVALVIVTGLLFAMMIVLFAVDNLPRFLRLLIPLGNLAIAVALGVFAWRWPSFEHRWCKYRVDRDGIEIHKGVVWRTVTNVPRSRIQHTDVSQGPIERNFELATLHIFTAGTEHSEVALHGLAHERAVRIRDHLLLGGENDGV
jgi:uncharacterized protein